MRRMLGVWVAASFALTEPACAQGAIDEAALAAIERTRTTDAAYSVYTWNRINVPGTEPIDEWAAEFHEGNFHRVETPRDRLIANCETRDGTHFNLVSGRRESGPSIAAAACGVQANSRMLSASFDGRTTGTFGSVEHITVRDPEHVRTYEIAENGAIVGATIEQEDGTILLESRAVALEASAPGDAFTQKSLERSFVAEEFRKTP